eukprot:2938231-Amphidinium_carterae.1
MSIKARIRSSESSKGLHTTHKPPKQGNQSKGNFFAKKVFSPPVTTRQKGRRPYFGCRKQRYGGYRAFRPFPSATSD